MTTLAEVRDGLAEAIQTGTGLRTMSYLGSSIPHPCCQIDSLGYDPRMVLGRAKASFEFVAVVYVGPVSERSSQQRCDRLREPQGDESIVTAVESLPTFVAGVDYGVVTRVGDAREVILAEETLLRVEFEIEVVF